MGANQAWGEVWGGGSAGTLVDGEAGADGAAGQRDGAAGARGACHRRAVSARSQLTAVRTRAITSRANISAVGYYDYCFEPPGITVIV